MRTLWLLPLLVLLAACDSGGDDLTLDADFYVGTWTMTGVRDARGSQDAAVNAVVDDLTATFAADGAFEIEVDFAAAVNASGQADRQIAGTYQAVADATPRLVLVVDGLAPAFTASATSASAVSLTTADVIVEQLLAGIALDFQGNVTIALARR